MLGVFAYPLISNDYYRKTSFLNFFGTVFLVALLRVFAYLTCSPQLLVARLIPDVVRDAGRLEVLRRQEGQHAGHAEGARRIDAPEKKMRRYMRT